MSQTFYFYDLETSGVRPSSARVMQFAGQRTDMQLKPIGEPDNFLIKLTNDCLPEPDAVLVTGITPQQTVADGVSEADFLAHFRKQIVQPDTIFLGFNSVRFDDEFMRFMQYRNFYDPYEWQWKNDCSRWDLLDVVRMTRALRPAGIKWPVNSEGKASNALGLLTAINKLPHDNAHDALGDVMATIELARLLKSKQPKLFAFLLGLRSKQAIAEFCGQNKSFVYSSGKYPSEFEKTTVVMQLAPHPKRQGVLVYDLRHNPTPFATLSAAELAEAWRWRPKEEPERLQLPIKTMQFNRCPAVAPLSVLSSADKKRLQLVDSELETHKKVLLGLPDFKKRVLEALELLDKKQQAALFEDDRGVDGQLYDKFFDSSDKAVMDKVRRAEPQEITSFNSQLKDSRLQALLPLYKARNFYGSLTPEEHEKWEHFRAQELLNGGETSRMAKYFKRLEELAPTARTKEQTYLLEELKLWGESIMPEEFTN